MSALNFFNSLHVPGTSSFVLPCACPTSPPLLLLLIPSTPPVPILCSFFCSSFAPSLRHALYHIFVHSSLPYPTRSAAFASFNHRHHLGSLPYLVCTARHLRSHSVLHYLYCLTARRSLTLRCSFLTEASRLTAHLRYVVHSFGDAAPRFPLRSASPLPASHPSAPHGARLSR